MHSARVVREGLAAGVGAPAGAAAGVLAWQELMDAVSAPMSTPLTSAARHLQEGYLLIASAEFRV